MTALSDLQLEALLGDLESDRADDYDVQPVPSAKLTDLSRSYFEEVYHPKALAKKLLAANGRDYEERLAALRMIAAANDPTPTVLGLLTLSTNPQFWLPAAYVQFLRIQGTEWSDPIVDEATLRGRLERIIERLDDLMDAHNRVAVDITSDRLERRHAMYPLEALRQLCRNAIMHRAYEHASVPVRVYWFDDRVEIISPGGPFGEVTIENFGQPGVCSYRNPHIAESMRVLNLVQRFGVGIQTAQSALRANGNPPATFEVNSNFIFARVYPNPPAVLKSA